MKQTVGPLKKLAAFVVDGAERHDRPDRRYPDEIPGVLDKLALLDVGQSILQHDGLLNKTIGYAIMAIFNFPIRHDDHTAKALRAALAMQRTWRARRKELLVTRGIQVISTLELVSAAAS
jgi:hypothetical protein